MDPVIPRSQGIQIGVDIGQSIDPTAIVVAERELRDYQFEDRGRATERLAGGELHYVIRHVERLALRTSYPRVVERLAEIHGKLQNIRGCLVDATGVGKPVVDLIRAKGIACTAVYLTGGEKATASGDELHLAKELLVSRLQVLLQQRRIHLPQTTEAQALVDELLNYEIKVNANANVQTGVFKTGAHDDLATALGLACWEDRGGSIGFFDAPDAFTDWRG